MFRFVLLACLALVPASTLFEVPDFKTAVESARFGDLTAICEWFCGDDSIFSSIFSRSLGSNGMIHPRIFCELCDKKTTSGSSESPSTNSVTQSTPSPSAGTTSSSAAPGTGSSSPITMGSDTPGTSTSSPGTMSSASSELPSSSTTMSSSMGPNASVSSTTLPPPAS